MNYNTPISKEKLKEYMDYHLTEKIELSKKIIQEFYEENKVFNKKFYISSSFGKDSIVLIDLVRQLYPNIPIIYINTGVEPKECVELSKTYDNVIEISPKLSIEEVIDKYGYITPLGKDKSSALNQVRHNLSDGKFDTFRCNQMRGEQGFDYSKYQKHLLAPFKISDKCCYYLKISPLGSFCRKNGFSYSFVGITADESNHRQNTLLDKGFSTATQCRPMGHWTKNDVLRYIKENNLPLAKWYGDIVIDAAGNYHTSLNQRNGCICCPINAQHETPNKFQIMQEHYPLEWDYVMNVLGFDKVCKWFGVHYKTETVTVKLTINDLKLHNNETIDDIIERISDIIDCDNEIEVNLLSNGDEIDET